MNEPREESSFDPDRRDPSGGDPSGRDSSGRDPRGGDSGGGDSTSSDRGGGEPSGYGPDRPAFDAGGGSARGAHPAGRGSAGRGSWPDLRTFRPGVIPLGPLGIGEIFAGAIATLRSHPVVLFGTAFVAIALSQILTVLLTQERLQDIAAAAAGAGQLDPEQANEFLTDMMAILGVSALAALPAYLIVTALATIVVGRAVLGETIELATAWEELKPRLLPLLGVVLLVGVIAGAGLMLFFVPGVWAYVLLALAAPALILERCSPLQALRRSKDLVLGSWWRIFGILLVAALAAFAVTELVSLPFEIIGGGTGAGLGPGTTSGEVLVLTTLGSVLAGTLVAPFVASVHALIYIDRRIRTEGLAVDLARAAGMAPPDAGPPGAPRAW